MSNKNNSLPTWYSNYGKMIVEQNTTIAVFSEDANERLKQYLDSNENLLEEINTAYQKVADGSISEASIILDGSKFKVKPGDEMALTIDRSNSGEPRIMVSLENEKTLVGDLNLSTIAGYVYKSMDGMGTDELQYASAVAAIHMDLCERNVSERGTQRVFDIFNADAFGTKYEGYTLDEIAKRLNIPVETVRNKVMTALLNLKDYLCTKITNKSTYPIRLMLNHKSFPI